MEFWALERLRCPVCRRSGLEPEPGRLLCRGCGAESTVTDGVGDFVGRAHPAVAKERKAIADIDAGEARLPVENTDESDPETAAVAAYHRHVDQSRERLREVLERYPPQEGAVIVELGADHCWASEVFLEHGCRVIAVDISDHLYRAERAGDPDLCRLQSDMNDLPLTDGCVDAVWAVAAAHHSWSLEKTFAEAARVLKPGGFLAFCCEPMPSWLRYPFGLAFGADERELGINETWNHRGTWLAEARAAGFEAELVFPRFDRAGIEARLRSKGLPTFLAGWIAPVLPLLQVSIHLVATKPAKPSP